MVIPFVGPVSGDEIISSLLCFEQFNKFYYKEYEPIKEKITLDWWVYPELGVFGYYAMCGVNKETGRDAIWLEWPPVTLGDAYLVAHELEHIIRKANNLSIQIVEKDLRYVDVGGCIRSVLEDRIVDEMLKVHYDFNLVGHYIEELSACENLLKKPVIKPTQVIDRLKQILIHADCILRWSLIDNDMSFKHRFDVYQKLFKIKLRDVANEAQELALRASSIKLEKQDGQKQLFNYIINKYELGDALYILEN